MNISHLRLGSFLSVNRLSLRSGKVCSGKLERIFASINFSIQFSRIHAKETQKLFDPTKAKCCKLVQQQEKTRSSTFQALSFLRIFQQKRPTKNNARQTKCCKLSRSTDRNDPYSCFSEPLTEEIILKIFGSPDLTVFLLDRLSARDSVYSRENLLENLGTPLKMCLICTGTPVKTHLKFWHS